MIEDVRVWLDGEATAPVDALPALLTELGYAGKRVGVEYHSFGLTGRHARMLDDTLSGAFRLSDTSELIARLRVIKSDAEIVCAREAARLTNLAFDEARRLTVAGAFEGDILAAAQGAVFAGGGDYPGNEFTIASGAGALLPRYFSGRRHLDAKDQLMLQLGGAYRRYHTALMATICVGGANDHHRLMHRVAKDCLIEAHATLRPGRQLSDIYRLYERAAHQAGLADCILSACGYSLGVGYHPTWMDWPWIYPKSDVILQPNMIFYVHMLFLDRSSGNAMAVGDTSLVTTGESERLTTPPLALIEA
jgi:Xaa-Pro dipeptidase